MSQNEDKLQAARLHAGHVDGEKLKILGQFPEGTTVQKDTGEKAFLPAEFLRLLLLRRRGQDT